MVWWTAVVLLLAPALLSGLAFTALQRVDAVLTDWWDDFHAWAYQGREP
jgi:hypothetical protein